MGKKNPVINANGFCGTSQISGDAIYWHKIPFDVNGLNMYVCGFQDKQHELDIRFGSDSKVMISKNCCASFLKYNGERYLVRCFRRVKGYSNGYMAIVEKIPPRSGLLGSDLTTPANVISSVMNV